MPLPTFHDVNSILRLQTLAADCQQLLHANPAFAMGSLEVGHAVDPSRKQRIAPPQEQQGAETRVAMEAVPYEELPDEHTHYSQRAPWLRAAVLGANDGLVSVASLMVGVGGGTSDLHIMVLAGLAGLVGGALSMACGEYISVSSQRDSELADIDKERREQEKGPQARLHELEELAKIYEDRGVSPGLARQVAEELTAKDVIKAHARDELGIDLDDMVNPAKAALASALAFTVGAGLPLLAAAFISSHLYRIVSLIIVSTFALAAFGILGAVLGGAGVVRGATRVLIGGWIALGITYGIGRAFGGGATSA